MPDGDADLTQLPRGQMALRDFVTRLSPTAARVERDFLEVKGEIDLNSKTGRAKLAKFILGAANRDPSTAARRLDGHALLVLGIRDGVMHGVAPFEAHELQRDLKKYLGDPGPTWDFDFLSAESGRSVVVVYVAARHPNKQPWICRAAYPQEKMQDGDIFIRADGETRRANSEEVQQMLERRDAAAVPDVDLLVSIDGVVRCYRYDAEVIDNYIDGVAGGLLNTLPTARTRPSNPYLSTTADLAAETQAIFQRSERAVLGLGGSTPENRTEQQYRAEVERWTVETRRAVPELLDEVVADSIGNCAVRIRNLSGYLAEPEFEIHIGGEVEAVNRPSSPVRLLEGMPRRPRKWGPYASALGLLGRSSFAVPMPDISDLGLPGHGRVEFENGGSVSMRLDLADLRPGQTFTSAPDEFVLLWRGSDPPTELRGTWSATAQHHDRIYQGEFTVAVDPEVVDITDWLRAELWPERAEDAASADPADDRE